MTYFADLTPYAYISEEEKHLLNVGWIDNRHEYPTGETPPGFREKLAWLCVNSPEKDTPGIHTCTLCPPMPFGFHMVKQGHNQQILGSAEIRVKGHEAEYAAPDLVLHYVLDHGYLPPDDFIAGVLMVKDHLPLDQWSLIRGPHWA